MSISVDSPLSDLDDSNLKDDGTPGGAAFGGGVREVAAGPVADDLDWDDESDEFEDEADEPTRIMAGFSDGFFFSDRFKIRDVLGSGGMGTVYDAIDMQSDRRVALKVLKKKRGSEESAARFRREAEILATIDHPSVVGIHGFGAAQDGTLWLAMEYLEGETLRERVANRGPMDPTELAPVIAAACAALSSTHARGVIHRDLKPDNIFLTSATPPEVKILDFGLSLSLSSKKLTQTGTVIGTPRYMAPEQIKSAHAAGAQADIYALGVIAYEVMTGESPFVASDHGQLLGAILTGRKQPLHEHKPDYPEAIEEVLVRAMAPSTDDRYQTPEEFAAAFSDAASIHEVLRNTPAPERVRGKPTVRMPTPPPELKAPPTGPKAPQTTEEQRRARVDLLDTNPPGGGLAAPKAPDEEPEIPRWMIPFIVLGGFAIMGVGAAIAYLLIR